MGHEDRHTKLVLYRTFTTESEKRLVLEKKSSVAIVRFEWVILQAADSLPSSVVQIKEYVYGVKAVL
jgi:hypothetical protein